MNAPRCYERPYADPQSSAAPRSRSRHPHIAPARVYARGSSDALPDHYDAHPPVTTARIRGARSFLPRMCIDALCCRFHPTYLLKNLLSFFQSLVGGALEREEILVVSASVGRVLHAAQSAGHATALVQRSENFEGHVEFVVGAEQRFSPRPSVVVGDLLQLVA